jgi:hypothetical protein
MSNHFNTAMEREESNFVEDKSRVHPIRSIVIYG